jgi:hypothetical protein
VSGAPRKRGLRNSPASGTHRSRSAIIHRTCPVNHGATATSAPTATCGAFNVRSARAEGRRAHTGAPDREHPGGPTSQKLQRSESNGSDYVAGAPDISGVHRTVRCAIEQTVSQLPLLVVGAINTPTTPPFIASKFSTSQPLTRARHSILDTPKRSNPLQFYKRL